MKHQISFLAAAMAARLHWQPIWCTAGRVTTMTWTGAAQLALHFAVSSNLCCYLQAPEATEWQLAAPVTTNLYPAWAPI